MKTNYFILCLFLLIQPYITYAEDWRIYDASKTGDEGYFDKDSIKRNKSLVKVWTSFYPSEQLKRELEEKAEMGNVKYAKRLIEIDCKNETYRQLSFTVYRQNGEIIGNDDKLDKKWSPITPGTRDKTLCDIICKKSPKLSYIINLGDEIKKTIPQCWKTQKKYGMAGLIELSQKQYDNLKKNVTIRNIEKCMAVDMYSYAMDSAFAKRMGYPPNSVTVDYFSIENLHHRIFPYLLMAGMSFDDANYFMILWEVAVDKEIGKMWEGEIYK